MAYVEAASRRCADGLCLTFMPSFSSTYAVAPTPVYNIQNSWHTAQLTHNINAQQYLENYNLYKSHAGIRPLKVAWPHGNVVDHINDCWRQGRRSHRIIGGGHKSLGDEVLRSGAFIVKLHIIFALKYNKQQLLLLRDKINLA